MNEKKLVLEVSRITKGGINISVKTELSNAEEMAVAVKQLSDELDKCTSGEAIEQISSIPTQPAFPQGISPAPQLNDNVSDLPVLLNPPHSYTPGDAVVELLNPLKSKWATQPRPVKEIQTRLIELGIRGVASIQTFDGVMRRLLKQGKVRREVVDGSYKYYLVTGKVLQ